MHYSVHKRQKRYDLPSGLPLKKQSMTPKIYKYKDIVKDKFTTTYTHTHVAKQHKICSLNSTSLHFVSK